MVLDLEDGVAPQHKAFARETLAGVLAHLSSGLPYTLVRINSRCSEWTNDLDAVTYPGVSGLMVAKCESVADLAELDFELASIETRRAIGGRTIRFFLLIESARGLLNLPTLAATSDRTAGLVLGAEDLCLDMGIQRTRAGTELSFARWQIALCARANRLAAIDTVFADFKDTEGLWQDSRIARNMGLTGKLAIHPRQIEPIHSAFAPDEEEVAAARATLTAFERAQASGQGVVALQGSMVDEPIAERAREILRRAGPRQSEPYQK